MKLVSEVTIALKKGTLPQLVDEFIKSGCEIKRMNEYNSYEDNKAFRFEVIYENQKEFDFCITSFKKAADKYFLMSVENSLEDILRGGLLRTSGKLPFETIGDYEINILGAAELIKNQITRGSGEEYCGIPRTVANVCAVRDTANANDRLYPFHVMAERDSLILRRFSDFNSVPLVFKYNQLDDCIKLLRNASAGFRALRIFGIEESDSFFYDQITGEFPVPVVIRELDEIPLYMLSLVLKCAGRNKMHPDDTNVGILGLDSSTIRLTRLLSRSGFRRILGYDVNDKNSLSFEGQGGLATTTENIFSNADMIILMKKNFDDSDFRNIRPGQFIISMLKSWEVQEEELSNYGVREFVQGSSDDLSFIFPGLLQGVVNAGLLAIDDQRLIELSKRLANLISTEYSFPNIFGDIHGIIADLLDETGYNRV